MEDIFQRIRNGLDDLKVVDVHSHLGTSGMWKAKTLAHLVSYHWLSVELARAKGAPVEADAGQDPEGYVREVLPYFPAIRNTSNHYAVMAVLRDLYGLEGRTLTEDNWRAVDAKIRETAEDAGWFVEALDRANIAKVLVLHSDPGMPHPSGRCVPYEMGEPMFVFERPSDAKRIFGKTAEPPATLEGLVDGIRKRIGWLATERNIRALHNWMRGTWVYRDEVKASDAAGIYERVVSKDEAVSKEVTQDERDRLMSFTADVAAEEAAKHGLVIQIFHGMIAYTKAYSHPCVTHFNPQFFPALTKHFWKHPETRYDVFLGTRTPSHETASLSRVYPNVSVSGAWWHGFSPTTLSEYFRDRLELLPNTAWNAFYSDGYMVEWLYGKLAVTKNRLAHALAGMTAEGFITEDDALDIASKLLYDNPVRIYGIE